MNILQDFRAQWDATRAQWGGKPDKFTVLPDGDYPFLNDEEQQLLQRVGLPQSGPDFSCSFNGLGAGMPRVDESYGMNKPEDAGYWARLDREKIVRYRIIGQNSGGDPLVFNIESREIILLNHENMFEPAEFVNSSFAQFYQSLLLMQRAYNKESHEIDVAALQAEVAAIDAKVTAEQGYWHTLAIDLPDLLE